MNNVQKMFDPKRNHDISLKVPVKHKRTPVFKIVLLTALITSMIALSLSYFAFSEKTAFEFYNRGKLVCFTQNHSCYKLVGIK